MVKLKRSYLLENLTLESKKDLDDLRDYLGDDLFDSYMKIRNKISDPNFKDFSKLKKMDKKDIQDFVSSFQSKSDKKKQDKQEGAKKLYEDKDWVVYKITTYPAAQLYGKGTKWCITGRYPGHENRGQEYFDDYIRDNNLDGGYYFYLNKKDPSKKYCVLQTKNNVVHSIWDAKDTNRGSSLSQLRVKLPEIKDVNLKKYSMKTLMDYIENNNIRGIKKLIDSGIDVNEPFEDDLPLYNGAYSLPVVRCLVENGADVNKLNPWSGSTVLYRASSLGVLPVVKYLVENGADVNSKNLNGETSIFGAASNMYYNIVEYLLENGADPNIENDHGYTLLNDPLYSSDRLRELLIKYGAKE